MRWSSTNLAENTFRCKCSVTSYNFLRGNLWQLLFSENVFVISTIKIKVKTIIKSAWYKGGGLFLLFSLFADIICMI